MTMGTFFHSDIHSFFYFAVLVFYGYFLYTMNRLLKLP